MILVDDSIKVNISYLSSGLFITKEDWIHPTRQIDSYEIIYMLEGEVFIQEENVQYTLSKGDILILYPNRKHFGFMTSTNKTSFYWTHFVTSDFDSLELKNQHLSYSDNFQLTGMFKQLLHIAHTSYYQSYSTELMLLLIISEIAVLQKENQNKSRKLLKDIIEWVRINNNEKITVNDVADNFKYNPDYLSTLFKKTFGMGLKQYINNERMKNIKNLLLTSNYSIKQLAAMLGYESENQLIHYFKYHESISPTKYRNMYYNTHLNNK